MKNFILVSLLMLFSGFGIMAQTREAPRPRIYVKAAQRPRVIHVSNQDKARKLQLLEQRLKLEQDLSVAYDGLIRSKEATIKCLHKVVEHKRTVLREQQERRRRCNKTLVLY